MNTVEFKIGYEFKDKNLLTLAFTHSSYAYPRMIESNERLEFLGDSVLNIIVTKYLYAHTDRREGELSKIRARLVSADFLSHIIDDKNLGVYLKTENMPNLSIKTKGNLYEAILGAIYVDNGEESLDVCAKLVENNLGLAHIDFDTFNIKDYKSVLQELVQSKENLHISYVLLKQDGPKHNPEFTVCVKINGVNYGTAKGCTKKEAENFSAKIAIDKLKKELYGNE